MVPVLHALTTLLLSISVPGAHFPTSEHLLSSHSSAYTGVWGPASPPDGHSCKMGGSKYAWSCAWTRVDEP
jgi:hypothetical protein